MIRLKMKSYNRILTVNQRKYPQSALSSGKIDKYVYLTGQKLTFDQRKMTEQTRFT